jgi:hypothetical protein
MISALRGRAGPYAKKILGIRNDKSEKNDFNVQEFRNADSLEFLVVVSAGWSIITPAEKSFFA